MAALVAVSTIRSLNVISKRDAYPLPRIDQCLDALGGDNHFSRPATFVAPTIRLQWMRKMHTKLHLFCHRGMFIYRRLPMGLLNSPSTFQRLNGHGDVRARV